VPLWVVLLVGLASPLASFGTAWITVRLTNSRELRRLRHERDLKEAEFEDKKRAELREERRKAYRTMSQITLFLNPREEYEFTDLAEAYSEIQLLTTSPAVLTSAWNLFGEANKARKRARDAYKAGIKDVANDPLTRISFAESQEMRKRFLDAAREELELSSLPALEAGMIIPRVVAPSQADDAPAHRSWWRRFLRVN
jgi:hypothetical protein